MQVTIFFADNENRCTFCYSIGTHFKRESRDDESNEILFKASLCNTFPPKKIRKYNQPLSNNRFAK